MDNVNLERISDIYNIPRKIPTLYYFTKRKSERSRRQLTDKTNNDSRKFGMRNYRRMISLKLDHWKRVWIRAKLSIDL